VTNDKDEQIEQDQQDLKQQKTKDKVQMPIMSIIKCHNLR
jgi:hypothetical protein